MLHRHIQTAVSLIYPPSCLSCGAQVQDDFGLCGSCWSETDFLSGACCDSCGCAVPGELDPGEVVRCDHCLADPPPWNKGRAALVYGGQGRRLVLALKHGDRTDLARPAARWMARAGQAVLHGDPLLVPVPLHWSRFLRRGYNQAALLAQALAQRSGLECCPDALLRVKMTPMLEHKSRQDRHTILREAIRINPRRAEVMRRRGVVLVDDVMTSGATLRACAEIANANGAKELHVLVLARVTGA